jgi:hypothetical protein
MLRKTLLTITVLVLASLTAFGASKDGIALSKDGRMTISTVPAQKATRNAVNDEGLVTIFDNIGTDYPNGAYWCCLGYTVTGRNAISNFAELWEGAAFTPTAAAHVTTVEVALSYESGTNAFVVGLYTDASGLPGTALKMWNVSNLPAFGSCCVFVTETDPAGISVEANTQYWIVVRANAPDSYGVWNLNVTDQVDSMTTAYYCSPSKDGPCPTNNAWFAAPSTPGLAFAVKGN